MIHGSFDGTLLLVVSAIGNLSWVVATIAAALAFHPAGAGRPVVGLLALSAAFVLRDAGLIGALGPACFAVAAVRRAARRPGQRPPPSPRNRRAAR